LQSAQWIERLTANGNIVPWQEAIVGAEVTGVRIRSVRVSIGDKVHRGQLLATLDADTLQANEAEAMALLKESEAQFEEAGAAAARTQKLRKVGFISAQQADQAVTGLNAAHARMNVQVARHQASALRLSWQNITSPDDGVISQRTATVGALTQPGGELFRLIRQGRLEWHADLTADELAIIRQGMKVELITTNGKIVSGVVRTIAPVVNTQTRYGQALVDLSDDSTLRAGMYVRGSILLNPKPETIAVLPQSAVVLRDKNAYVFIIKDNQQVEAVSVGIGHRTGGQIQIISGLAPGVPVVKSGGEFLVTGDKVRVIDMLNDSRVPSK
jgi:RND family efflux transporter MFP subunit